MSDFDRFTDSDWDKFFEFISPNVQDLTREEVREELARRGIDTARAVSRVRHAAQAVRARASLEEAKRRRTGIVEKLSQVAAPITSAVRGEIQKLIEEKLEGSLQAAFYRKLESAASEDDLKSLLDDIQRLETLKRASDESDPEAK